MVATAQSCKKLACVIFSLFFVVGHLKLYILLFAKRYWHPITPTHQISLLQGFIRNQRLFLYLSKIYDKSLYPATAARSTWRCKQSNMHSVDVKSRTRLMAGTMTRILYMYPKKNITLTLCMDVLS